MTYVKYSLNTSSLRPINVAFAKPDPFYWPAKQSNIKEKRCITLEGNPSHTRAFIPSCLESFLDLIAEYINSLQWSVPTSVIYVGVPSSASSDTLSDHKSSKKFAIYNNFQRVYCKYSSEFCTHHLLLSCLGSILQRTPKPAPRDAIDTAGAASSESSSGLHRSAKHKTLAL